MYQLDDNDAFWARRVIEGLAYKAWRRYAYDFDFSDFVDTGYDVLIRAIEKDDVESREDFRKYFSKYAAMEIYSMPRLYWLWVNGRYPGQKRNHHFVPRISAKVPGLVHIWLRDRLRNGWNALKDDEREVAILVWIDGLTVTESARELCRNRDYVKLRLDRAMRTISRHLPIGDKS